MRLINASYPRNGTYSSAVATELLLGGGGGGSGSGSSPQPACHAGRAVLIGRDDAWSRDVHRLFVADEAGDRAEVLRLLRRVTAGYASVADFFACLFPAELLEVYPDAEVILTRRDEDKWRASMAELTDQWALLSGWRLWPVPSARWFSPLIGMCCRREQRTYNPAGPNQDSYLLHREWVKRVVPAHKLHVVELTDGWSGLCSALKLPVPDEPYPHVNEKEAFPKLIKALDRRAGFCWSAIAGALGITGFLVFRQRALLGGLLGSAMRGGIRTASRVLR